MRRLPFFLGMIGLALGIGSLATAQTVGPPHMELVRGLRANGLSDLALQYLDQLKASKPHPEVERVLPLEYARTWLDLAADEPEEAKRKDLIAKAEERLEAFINSSKGHPLLPQANVELARLISLKGKGIFLKARKMEKEPDDRAALRNKELARARDTLKKAADKYQATIGILEAELKKVEKETTPAGIQRRRELSQFLMKSMLDQGIVFFEMGNTYDESGGGAKDTEQRGNQFKAAKKVFEKLMYMDDKEPLCWQGRAWSAECDFKTDENDVATRAINDLLTKKNNPAAAAGVRVARYFGIFRTLEKDAKDNRQRLIRGETAAADWLRDYSAYRNTTEGNGARYYLAYMKYLLGLADLNYDKGSNRAIGFKSGEAKPRLEDAQRLFRELAESENEHSEKATRYRSIILVSLADAENRGDSPPPETLATFEVCFLMAQVEIARLGQFQTAQQKKEEPKNEEPKPDPKKNPPKKGAPEKEEPKAKEDAPKVEDKKDANKADSPQEAFAKEERKRFTNAKRYLEYGLKLVTPKDPVRDVFNAHLYLMDCYRKLDQHAQAAILGEYVAHVYQKQPRAALAAAVAVRSYNVAHQKQVKDGDEPSQMPAADIQRVRDAASFLVKEWPNDAAADEGRHILGFFLLREAREKADKDEQRSSECYLDAWTAYAGIRDTYPAVYSARNELAGLMIGLIRPSNVNDAKILNQRIADNLKKYSDLADPKFGKMFPTTLKMLEELRPPEPDCLLVDALSYLNAQSSLSMLYQLQNNFDKMRLAGEQILKCKDKFDVLKADAPELSPMEKEVNRDRQENFGNVAKGIILASVRAKAYKQFKDDKNYAAVAESLNPTIAEMEKEFDQKQPANVTLTPALKRVRDTQRAILILALQASVQDQKVDRAADLIRLLDKSGSSVEDNQNMLRSMVANVRAQIDELEELKKIDDAKKLKEGFTTFLDKIIDSGKNLPLTMKMFIAQGYTGVDAFEKASVLLEDVRKNPPQKPAALEGNPDPKKQKEYDDALAAFENYPNTKKQVEYALARNYRQAALTSKDTATKQKNYDAALKVFLDIIGPIGGPKPMDPKVQIKQFWAFTILQVRKEKASMLEEMAAAAPAVAQKGMPTKSQLWGTAVQEWVAIIRIFSPSLPVLPGEIDPNTESLDPRVAQDLLKKFEGDDEKDRAKAVEKFSYFLRACTIMKSGGFQGAAKRLQSENKKERDDAVQKIVEVLKNFSKEVTDVAEAYLRERGRLIKEKVSRDVFLESVKAISAGIAENRPAGLPAITDSFQILLKKLLGENDKDRGDAQVKLTELFTQLSNPDVIDLAHSCFKAHANLIKGDEDKLRFELAIKEIKTAVDENRKKRANEAATTANKRKLYFELFFEQKRCSTLAYSDLGLAAVPKGGQADLDAKFRQLAQDFHDLKTKNPDVPAELKERIDDLIKKNKNLNAGHKSLLTGN
jgi:hypothetical protein